MHPSRTRRLLVPTLGGVVAAFLIVGVLIVDLATRNGPGLTMIYLGLVWMGPWALLVALPICAGGGLVAGALSVFHGGWSPRLVLAALFLGFVGYPAALAVTFLVPYLWWPSGVAAMLLTFGTATATAWITFPTVRARSDNAAQPLLEGAQQL